MHISRAEDADAMKLQSIPKPPPSKRAAAEGGFSEGKNWRSAERELSGD
jgi:hypothetical protein